ncbi:hypothetical protein TNCV_613241 [Trichonephila clavipes]|nr:hypothetical protein TNCV_613241 [Trichonephila clavipes]
MATCFNIEKRWLWMCYWGRLVSAASTHSQSSSGAARVIHLPINHMCLRGNRSEEEINQGSSTTWWATQNCCMPHVALCFPRKQGRR